MTDVRGTPHPLDCPHRFTRQGRCKYLELCAQIDRICNGRLYELGLIGTLTCDGCSLYATCSKGKARKGGDWRIPSRYGELCAPMLHYAQAGTDYSEFDSKVLVFDFREIEHAENDKDDWRTPDLRYQLCDLRDYEPESVGITEKQIYEIYKTDTRRRGYRKPSKAASRDITPFEAVPVLVIDSTVQYLIDTQLTQGEIAAELRISAGQVHAVSGRLREELENGCYAGSPRQAELLRILVVDRGRPPNNRNLSKKLGVTEKAIRELKEKLKNNAPWSYWGLPKT